MTTSSGVLRNVGIESARGGSAHRSRRSGAAARRADSGRNRSSSRSSTRSHAGQATQPKGNRRRRKVAQDTGHENASDLPLNRALIAIAKYQSQLVVAAKCDAILPLESCVRLSVQQRLECGDRTVGFDLLAELICELDQIQSAEEELLGEGIGLPAFAQQIRDKRIAEGNPPDYSRAARRNPCPY